MHESLVHREDNTKKGNRDGTMVLVHRCNDFCMAAEEISGKSKSKTVMTMVDINISACFIGDHLIGIPMHKWTNPFQCRIRMKQREGLI